MKFRGARVKVKVTSTHISWKPVNPVGCCVSRRSLTKQVPLDEVLSALALPKPADVCCCPRDHSFVVYSFVRKSARDPNTWRLEEYVLSAGSPDQVREWVGLINSRVLNIRERPRNLLVYINPFAGARLARLTWEREVLPVFQRARLAFTVIETTKQDHARENLELLKSEELAGYHGVVAVGGDGLFQEVVSGLLTRRARGDSAAHRIRVGHIPAGSTDAVAYTLHGSRSATSAALHIALGDRLSLDSARVQAADGSVRHFVCQAGYGFMGDVMRFSERLRFMGPVRYDVTGALQYMRLASYRVSLSYREAPSTTADVQQLCTAQCEVCRMAGIRMGHASSFFHLATAVAANAASAAIASGGSGSLGSPSGASYPPLGAPGIIGMVNTTAAGAAATTTTGAAAGISGISGSGGLQMRCPLPLSSVAAGGGSGGSATAAQAAQADLSSSPRPGTPPGGGGGGGGLLVGLPGSFHSFHAEGSSNSGPLASVGCPPNSTSRQPSAPVSQSSATGLPVQTSGLLYDPQAATAAGGTERTDSAPSSLGNLEGFMGVVGGGAAGGGGSKAPGRQTSAASGGSDGWTTREGEFVSIMCVVTPCRSDKSKRGIVPNGHLSDGRMYLVLVEKCSHVSFLRFLVRLSTRGLTDLCLPFVRVIPITALRLSPLPGGHHLGGCLWDAGAPESAWNVDGELLSNNNVEISVARGALEVFARGPETTTVNL